MMKRWLRRLSLAVIVLIVLAGVAATIDYLRWRSADNATRVIDGSTVVQTPRGPIEFAELGRGRPMLMVHGSPGGFDAFYSWLRRIHGPDGPPYRAIMPSRPGYLRTPLSTGRTSAEQADAMAALLDALGVGRAVVYGLSDGGPSALQFALRHGDRCRGLILVSAVTRRIVLEDFPWWVGVLDPIMSGAVGAWVMSRSAPQVMRAESGGDPDVLSELMAIVDSMKPYAPRAAGLQNDQEQDRQMEPWPLHEIKCPTLVVHGTADWMVPPVHGETVAAIPGARLVRLDGAGHLAFVTHRAQIDAAIAEFLEAHPD